MSRMSRGNATRARSRGPGVLLVAAFLVVGTVGVCHNPERRSQTRALLLTTRTAREDSALRREHRSQKLIRLERESGSHQKTRITMAGEIGTTGVTTAVTWVNLG